MDFIKFIPFIIIALLILLLMVTIHEFGHYIAGRSLGFKINEFAVGFGPVISIPKFWDKAAMERIRARKAAIRNAKDGETPVFTAKEMRQDYLFRFQWNNKRGEFVSIRWFPLGGFCAFHGEDDGKEEDGAFNAQKPWKRLIVQFAGAFFNIVSAIIFAFIYLLAVGYYVPRITKVYDATNSSIVQQDDIRVGDTIIAVDGKEIGVMKGFNELFDDFTPGKTYMLTIERMADGEPVTVEVPVTVKTYTVNAKTDNQKDEEKPQEFKGIGYDLEAEKVGIGIWRSLGYSVPFTAKVAWQVISIFGQLLIGKIPLSALGGPITTIATMGTLAQESWANVLILLPLIAVNLGVFNLFPIPSLDGARMVFTTIEWIRKKPINRNVEGMIHTVGLFVLMGFVVIVDLLHLFL